MKQFLKFCIVGLSNTAIAYFINMFILWLLTCLKWHYDYIVANFLAFAISVLWSYFWNNGYVFKIKEGEQRSSKEIIIKSYILYGFTGIVLNGFLLWVWVDLLGIFKVIAPWLNPPFSVAFTYIISKLWIYRNKSTE
jgi:putative flippase GtrA